MKIYIKGQGHMTKMAAMAINSKIFENCLLQNQTTYDFETWHEASVCRNHDPGMTLTYLRARST